MKDLREFDRRNNNIFDGINRFDNSTDRSILDKEPNTKDILIKELKDI